MEQITILLYTNQKYLPIAKLCAKQMDKFVRNEEIKKYLVSNIIDNSISFDDCNISLIEGNIPFYENSRHFAKTLIHGLKHINSDYVVLWLDDYILINELKVDVINNLISIMKDKEIDYLSFMSYDYNDWESIEIDYDKYGLPENIIKKFDNSFFYMFSVQPSIWKVNSLITILENNLDITVHEFDTTDIKNKKGEKRQSHNYAFWNTSEDFWDYNFNFACFNRTELTKNYAFDQRGDKGDYLVCLYSEIIRWGKFNFNTHENNKKFLDKFLSDHKINNENEVYKIFF